MKLDYLQFLELEVFTRFGTKLDAGVEAKIRRGRLLREILRGSPGAVVRQFPTCLAEIAFNAGMFDGFDPEKLPAALQSMQDGLEREPLPLDNTQRVAGSTAKLASETP